MSAPVCFVSMDNLNRVPYLDRYVGCLSSGFDLIYWDRAGVDEPTAAEKIFRYQRPCNVGGSGDDFLNKLLGYIGFRSYASRILRRGNYSMVVALTGNCAVLLSGVLLSEYRSKFVIDIRDYWHEDISWYHNREQKLIEASAAAVISSPAYRSFLGDHQFLIMHNDQEIPEGCHVSNGTEGPMVLTCVGAAKNLELDQQVLRYFANDDRFEVRFIGRGYERLLEFVEESNIENAVIEGAFPMKDTLLKYRGADAVINMYGNHSPYFDYALSNKLYFAARLGLPLLVCEDTYLEEVARGYSLGCSVNLEEQGDKDRILALRSSEIRSEREEGRRRFLSVVETDNNHTFAILRELFADAVFGLTPNAKSCDNGKVK